MKRVLFVCTGNTCRSPMAEAVLRSKNLPGLEVRSAGVYAAAGSDASVNAKKVLEENKIALEHRASMLSEEEIKWADLILTMTFSHKEAVLSRFPEAAEKSYTLREFADQAELGDIGDPYGGNLDVYRGSFLEIKGAVEEILAKLQVNRINE